MTPRRLLTSVSAVVGVAFALPGAYVLWRTAQLGGDVTEVWSEAAAPAWRTVQLAALVAASAAVIGTLMAWLVTRTDLPGRRVLRVLAPLPMALPSFIGAAAFITAVSPGGVLAEPLSWIGIDGPIRFRGMGAAWLVLTLFTYPYVYLPVGARLSSLRRGIDESAQLLGCSTWSTFRRVVLPQLRRPIAGGALLVFLYTVSDFGAVQLLGFDTLTRVVFSTYLSDRATSFLAATLVLVFALAVVGFERRMRGAHVTGDATPDRRTTPVTLGRSRLVALVASIATIALALAVPLVSLGYWAVRGLRRGTAGSFSELLEPALNGAVVSVIAAVVAVAAVLPVAVVTTRHHGRVAKGVSIAVVAGYAVPGLVIALGLVFWALRAPGAGFLYQTMPLLILGYVVHFGSQAMGTSEVAVAGVPASVRESATLLGVGPIRRWLTVELPLMRPGLLAGGGLVLLSTFKELPATLLLSPPGFQTLATDVWASYNEGFFGKVGLSSLALVTVSGVLTWLLILRRADWLNA